MSGYTQEQLSELERLLAQDEEYAEWLEEIADRDEDECYSHSSGISPFCDPAFDAEVR
jgi:hypothetical protein